MAKTLPSDIIINILSRLPTESLSECSLVCKPWKNFIYYDRSLAHMLSRRIYDQDSVDAVTSGKASFLYLFNSVKGHTLLKHLEYDDENGEKPLKFEIAKFIPVPDHVPCRSKKKPVPDHVPVEIIGSCNGLVCISVLSKKNDTVQDPIYICNPMTREFVYLPKLTDKFSRGDYVVSGFGYHPSTNQYKVV
ncbi:F-box protein At3g07870-like [Papaver somniferum]|uniref:F-box protein At3g07870-like n=1 Tax=Papaver somniferum TaxID=3469 RepID=UPI000E6FD450|nr:F-box protein At3g07870-like [Papaver somniferum]